MPKSWFLGGISARKSSFQWRDSHVESKLAVLLGESGQHKLCLVFKTSCKNKG